MDAFLQKERGLFGERLEARQGVDQLNIKMMEKQLNDVVVQILTLGLNLSDIFDFYNELDRLVKKCPHNAAVSYPLTALYSPTIFVCKKNVTTCAFLELSVKAVNLIQPLGDLSKGEYHRCKMLTPNLTAFYEEHYDEIKKSTAEKATTTVKLKDVKPIKGETPAAAPSKKEAPEEKKDEAKPEEKKDEVKPEEKPTES